MTNGESDFESRGFTDGYQVDYISVQRVALLPVAPLIAQLILRHTVVWYLIAHLIFMDSVVWCLIGYGIALRVQSAAKRIGVAPHYVAYLGVGITNIA